MSKQWTAIKEIEGKEFNRFHQIKFLYLAIIIKADEKLEMTRTMGFMCKRVEHNVLQDKDCLKMRNYYLLQRSTLYHTTNSETCPD